MKELMYISPVDASGRLSPPVALGLRNALQAVRGKKVQVRMKLVQRTRSLAQNDHYWGFVLPCVVMVLQDFGNDHADSEMAHEVCKYRFLPEEAVTQVKTPSGFIKQLRSTKRLTTQQWSDYIERIRVWCAEYGVSVPFPNEQEIL